MNLGEPKVERLEYRVDLRKKFKKRIDSAPCSQLLNALFNDSYQRLQEHEEASVRFFGIL
jgi:hypothetical protein